MQGLELQQFVVDKIEDAKGVDITTLDVRGRSSITDALIICTGTSSRHVASIADKLTDACRVAGVKPLAVDGSKEAEWVVVDLGEVIVHVMQQESRLMYQLEKLWGLSGEVTTSGRWDQDANLGATGTH